nr:hypothetical protein [Tanacetum cinerariifolium]
MAPKKRTTRSSPATTTPTTTPVTDEQLRTLIAQGVADVLAERDATRSKNGKDSHDSRTGVRRQAPLARECNYSDFMICKPLYFKGTEGVVKLTQWFERMEIVFRISNYTMKNQIKFATCTLLGSALTFKRLLSAIEVIAADMEVTTAGLGFYCWLRIEQYFQVQDYALWDVIENGNSFIPAAQTTTNDDVLMKLILLMELVLLTLKLALSTQVSTTSTQVSTANLSDATVYSFLVSQPNGSQLVHEDLVQIYEDDLEEMDLKWQLALMSMRTRKYRNQDNSRRTVNMEETASKAMVAIDGASFDSSYMTDREAMINSIKNDDQPLPRVTQVSIAGTTSTEQPPLKDKSMWSDQEKRVPKIDHLARSLLIQGLPNDIFSLIDSNKTAKDLWDALARHMLGSEYCE